MKRILNFFLLFVLIVFVPLSMVSGQDKKTEQKIKVVIADKDGEMTIIDTTFTGDSTPHTLTLKDGKVVYFASPGEGRVHLKSAGGKGNFYVTCTEDEDEDGKLSHQEKVVVVSGDNAEWTIMPSTGSVKHIYAKADNDGETETDTNTDVTKYVIAKDGVVVTVESKDGDKAKDILEALEKELKIKK